jgi:hypothetical protein
LTFTFMSSSVVDQVSERARARPSPGGEFPLLEL